MKEAVGTYMHFISRIGDSGYRAWREIDVKIYIIYLVLGATYENSRTELPLRKESPILFLEFGEKVSPKQDKNSRLLPIHTSSFLKNRIDPRG